MGYPSRPGLRTHPAALELVGLLPQCSQIQVRPVMNADRRLRQETPTELNQHMQLPKARHRWSVSPRQAITIQRRLAQTVVIEKPASPIARVAGVDCAFSRDGRHCLAAVVVWDLAQNRVCEEQVARRPLRFPYIPGLLSFREAPAILAALRLLRQIPDALMCDGQGLAHPRRFGLACHLGILTGLPALGCAKSRLIGEAPEPEPRRGSQTELRIGGETVGLVLRTQDRVKPVYLSVGHRLDPGTAVDLVLRCAIRCRLPEPTRLADRLVAAYKRELETGHCPPALVNIRKPPPYGS